MSPARFRAGPAGLDVGRQEEQVVERSLERINLVRQRKSLDAGPHFLARARAARALASP